MDVRRFDGQQHLTRSCRRTEVAPGWCTAYPLLFDVVVAARVWKHARDAGPGERTDEVGNTQFHATTRRFADRIRAL